MSFSGIAMLLLVAAEAPPGPPSPPSKAPVQAPVSGCKTPIPTEPGEIVVCAERPSGYRIDPDVLAAERIKKSPKGLKPPERHADTSCDTVGPMGCRGGATIDFVSAGLALAKMADKVSKGASAGSLFVTRPTPTEYELYLQAKREREAREEAAFEAAAVKAAKPEAATAAK